MSQTKHSEVFDEMFHLLDVSGNHRLNFQQILDFAATLPVPPLKSKLAQIYKKYDEDDSGDIDGDEFYGLCTELEAELKMTTEEMSDYYSKIQYQKLWLLVNGLEGKDVRQVKDTDEIKREELRAFLDITLTHIDFRGDLAQVFKQILGSEQKCDFKSFRKIVSIVVKGKNIVAITDIFTRSKQQRMENRARAINKFVKGATEVRMKIREQNEEDNILAISKAAKALPPPTDTEDFTEAFVLMDSRGGGVISLDAIYEFTESFPNPPQASQVRKLYSYFDEDGSGDIDPDEFVDFARALELLCKLSAKEMCGFFRQATFKRLFELVDQGGDGNNSVSKDELRTFLEAISPILSGRYTMEDIYGMMKRYESDELDFNQFCDLVTVLLKGKSISQVVQVFEDSMRRRKAQRHHAQKRFETAEKKTSLNLPGSLQGEIADGAAMRICFQCMEKKEKMRELQHENELLRSELLQLKQQLTGAASAEPVKTVDVRSIMEEDTMQGNPFSEIHELHAINTAPFYSKFPQFVKPALHAAKSARILDLCDWFEQLKVSGAVDTAVASRKVNESAPQVISYLEQLNSVLAPAFEDIAQILTLQQDLQEALLQHNVHKQPEVLEEKIDLIQSYRMHLPDVMGDVEWMLDSVVEEITSISSAAISAAPFSTKHFELVSLIIEVEHGLQEILDVVTVVLQFGSKQLSDGEIQAKRLVAKVVDSTDQSLLASILDTVTEFKARLTTESFGGKVESLAENLRELMKTASTAAAAKKDKCCMTMPIEFAAPAGANNGAQQRKRTASVSADATAQTFFDPANPTAIANRSASPRLRQKNLRPKDTVAHVDSILNQYHQYGLAMPSNFKRIDPSSNTFQFGTRKIELSAVDRSIVVKVGGGYMLLEEFCEKYSAMEMRRVAVAESRLDLGASRATTRAGQAAGFGSPGSPSSRASRRDQPPHETRVLFRGSGGMILK